HDLTDPYLPRSFGGAGRGKGHKIDTGDEQHKDGDGAENIDIPDIAMRLHIACHFGVGMKMYVGQGLEKETDGIAIFFELGQAHAHTLLQLRGDVSVYFLR